MKKEQKETITKIEGVEPILISNEEKENIHNCLVNDFLKQLDAEKKKKEKKEIELINKISFNEPSIFENKIHSISQFDFTEKEIDLLWKLYDMNTNYIAGSWHLDINNSKQKNLIAETHDQGGKKYIENFSSTGEWGDIKEKSFYWENVTNWGDEENV